MGEFDPEVMAKAIRVACGVECRAKAVNARDGRADKIVWVILGTVEMVHELDALWE